MRIEIHIAASSEELFDSLVSNSPDEKPSRPTVVSSSEDSPVKPTAKKGKKLSS